MQAKVFAKCRSSLARRSSTRTRHAPLERRQPDCRDAPAIAGSAEETDRALPKAAAPPHPARASELAQRSSTRPFVRFACIAAAAAGGYRTGERGEHRAYVRAKSPRDPVRYSVRASPGRSLRGLRGDPASAARLGAPVPHTTSRYQQPSRDSKAARRRPIGSQAMA